MSDIDDRVIVVSDTEDGGGRARVGRGHVWEFSLPSDLNFVVNLKMLYKTVLKRS